jgi:hypothetical protein
MAGEPTLLDRVERAAERIKEDEAVLAQDREALHAVMRNAYRNGIPIARIARAAGVSRQWADRIIRQ